MSEKVEYGSEKYKPIIHINYPEIKSNFKEGSFNVWWLEPQWGKVTVGDHGLRERFTLDVFPDFDLSKPSEQRDEFVLMVHRLFQERVDEIDKYRALDQLHAVLEKWNLELVVSSLSKDGEYLTVNSEQFEKDYPRLTHPLIRGSL